MGIGITETNRCMAPTLRATPSRYKLLKKRLPSPSSITHVPLLAVVVLVVVLRYSAVAGNGGLLVAVLGEHSNGWVDEDSQVMTIAPAVTGVVEGGAMDGGTISHSGIGTLL
jgi:hypothetical protein